MPVSLASWAGYFIFAQITWKDIIDDTLRNLFLDLLHTLELLSHYYACQLFWQNIRQTKIVLPTMLSWLLNTRGIFAPSDRFDDLDYLRRSIVWKALYQEMDMVLVSADLQKASVIITQFYLKANILKIPFYIVRKDSPTVFCRTDKVIDKIAYVMWQVKIVAISRVQVIFAFLSLLYRFVVWSNRP